MNDQVILRVTKRNGGLEVTTAGTGNDQLAAIRVAAAATFRVLTAARRLPEDMATSAIARGGRKKRLQNEGDQPGRPREVRQNHER